MPLRVVAVALALLLAHGMHPSLATAAGDPTAEWRTIETDHFRIHYERRNESLALRLAALAEETHDQLVPAFAPPPSLPVEVVVIDTVDTANGSARTVPYNLIRVFAMAPEADSTLGDSDDWLRGLFLHEYIHILHIDQISGVWDVVNAILGKTIAPNSLSPRWYVEGLATYGESHYTEGGRLRNNAYRMYLRMDMLEDNFRGPENLSGVPVEWPGASGWYLYGSDFVHYVAERYGPEGWQDFGATMGGNLSPLGVNQTAREIFGYDILQLWDDYTIAARAEFLGEAVAVRAAGETVVRPITDMGWSSAHPRCRGPLSIGYLRDDGYSPRRIETTDIVSGEREDWVDVFGDGTFDWFPDGQSLVFTQNARTENVYAFNDLFLYDRRTGETRRLTTGERAREPAVSPDGRTVAFIAVTNGGGVDLRELDVASGQVRVLYAAHDLELVSAPAYSPDGAWIAFSLWTADWGRDIYGLDRGVGVLRRFTFDRAQDLEPSFSPDGTALFFASDRTGIYNAYAYDLRLHQAAQITNVLGGVFAPRQCTPGGPLYVRTYGVHGFDIGYIEQWSTAPAPPPYQRVEVDYPDRQPESVIRDEHPYQPWRDLYPRAWEPIVSEDDRGVVVGGTVGASDPAGHHGWGLTTTWGIESERLGVGASYYYGRLPFDLSLFASRAQRTVTNQLVAETRFIPFEEEEWSAGFNLFLPLGDERSGHSLSFTYAFRSTRMLDEPRPTHDPGDIEPRAPEFGRLDDVSLGWSWSNTRAWAYGVGAQRGTALSLFVSGRSPITGADFESIVLSWGLRHYQDLPWLDHTLAFWLSGGIGRASFDRRPLFAVGGLPEQDLVLALLDQIPVGGGFLRGYEQFSQIGSQYHLFTTEYRMPLVNVDTGAYTLPFFIERMHLAAFADMGTAFDRRSDFESILVGVGAELRIEAWIGYVVSADFRIGYGRGLGEGGIDDFYVLYGGTF